LHCGALGGIIVIKRYVQGRVKMTIICVDDDAQTAKRTAAACQKIAQVDEAVSFTSPVSALEYFDEHIVDIAILDISMPRMSGIELASKIKQKSLSTAIIFLTTFPQ
jgi:two-component SAPR family response regulator